jgi:O-antigen ligase
LYSYYAKQGIFGEYAQHKLEAQSGEGGLLLGGRGEILASGRAILDSPLLGHGSWARDPTYSAILAENRAELGYKVNQNDKKDDMIPAHSHIFGAWVEGGVAGAVFWSFVLVYAIGSMLKVSGWEPLLPLFAFAGFMLTWDVLFSPISPESRFVTPYFIVAMIMLRVFQTEGPVAGWES